MSRSVNTANGGDRRLNAIASALCARKLAWRPAAAPAAAAVSPPSPPRYSADSLRGFGAALLRAAGMAPHQASIVADTCVEGDLLKKNTHGVRLLSTALSDLRSGAQAGTGEPAVLKDSEYSTTQSPPQPDFRGDLTSCVGYSWGHRLLGRW